MHDHLDRNLIGYGPETPDPQWPGDARIAVSFVLNYEEGGENTVLNGDAASETFLSETPGGTPIEGGRDLSIESMYEYGSRAGFWRILRLFADAETAALVTKLLKRGGGIARLADEAWLAVSAPQS